MTISIRELAAAPVRRAGRRLPGDPGRPLTASRRGARLGRLVLSGSLALWFLLPLLPLIMWAFADQWSFPSAAPTQWGTEGVESALAAGGWAAYGHSLALGAVVAAIATPVGALAARAIVAGWAPAPKLVAGLLFAPVAIPPFAAVFGTNVILLRAHIPGMAGMVLVLVVVALPYTTFTLRTAYAAFDGGYEDVARTLGASVPRTVARVQLPLMAPALTRAAFLAFLVGWSDYIVTLIIGGGQVVTLPLVTASLASGVGNDSAVAALSVGAIIPPVVALTLLARRELGNQA